MDGEEYMRLMRPLITEKGCLKCHAVQGYQEGDVRGGISVSVPMEPLLTISREHVLTLALGHVLLWLVGLGGIALGAQRLMRSEGERKWVEGELEKNVEQLGQANIRLQEADQLKSIFLATMSHELRTPLNSIIGFTGIMVQGLAGPLNDEQARQLGMVQNSARHLLNLINDVLDISKIEAGQLGMTFEPFGMSTTIQKVARVVTPLAEKKDLVLVVSMTPEVGQIVSDRRRVEQVLINLVNNAIKFTEKGEVRVECEVSDGWLVTRVVDTGIGIKPEDMGKLFEAFRQIDAGLTRRHEGTGLGLSICKKLVEMLGGEIWAESKWGVGSTFTFTLPMKMGGER
jgi:signal transduction histidine kinase